MSDNTSDNTIAVSQSSSSSQNGIVDSGETLEMDDGLASTEEIKADGDEERNVWGRLFPLGDSFDKVELSEASYVFGRDARCDYVFRASSRRNNCTSKQHFRITRYEDAEGFVELQDLSRNGTFVNGKKVGEGSKQVLKNNDEISVCTAKMKAFVYVASNSEEEEVEVDDEVRKRYTLHKLLGSGACGEVHLAFELRTCRRFAIKIINKNVFGLIRANSGPDMSVMNEVKVLKALKHPCIIQIEDVIDTESKLYIILELVQGGELFDRIANKGKLTEKASKVIFYQLLLAIKYLHENNITHRDLKVKNNAFSTLITRPLFHEHPQPENVLLWNDDEEPLIKVTDFGVSKIVDANTMLKTFCGTPNYLAPEIIQTNGSGSYTNAIDCWSLGVILHCCLVGYQPFSEDLNPAGISLYKQICSGKCEFNEKFWGKISKEAKDLVEGLLQVNPEKRFTTEQALDHPWLQDEAMQNKVKQLMEESNENGNLTSSSSLKRPREDGDVGVDEGSGSCSEPETKVQAV